MGILQQPYETIDACAAWVDDPSDLLAMALTCRKLASIVHPWHTQFRHIRCHPSCISIWSSLTASPALARNIRVLELSCTVPRIPLPFRASPLQQPTRGWSDAVFMEALEAALKKMWYLASFTWKARPPYGDAAQVAGGQNLWTVLSDCVNLTHLRVWEPQSWPPFFIWGSAVFTRMSNLRSLTYHTEAMSSRTDLSSLGVMLRERCPDLEHLDLKLGHQWDVENPPFQLDSHILSGRWHALRSLHFPSGKCSVEAVISFFQAHPNLLELTVDDSFLSDHDGDFLPFHCPPGVLMNLRKLECKLSRAVEILSYSDPSRPIEWLSVTDAHRLYPSKQYYDLLATLTTLKTVHIVEPTVEMVRHIAESAPWIQELECEETCSAVAECHMREGKKQWQKALALFHDLRVFRKKRSAVLGLRADDVDLLAIIGSTRV